MIIKVSSQTEYASVHRKCVSSLNGEIVFRNGGLDKNFFWGNCVLLNDPFYQVCLPSSWVTCVLHLLTSIWQTSALVLFFLVYVHQCMEPIFLQEWRVGSLEHENDQSSSQEGHSCFWSIPSQMEQEFELKGTPSPFSGFGVANDKGELLKGHSRLLFGAICVRIFLILEQDSEWVVEWHRYFQQGILGWKRLCTLQSPCWALHRSWSRRRRWEGCTLWCRRIYWSPRSKHWGWDGNSAGVENIFAVILWLCVPHKSKCVGTGCDGGFWISSQNPSSRHFSDSQAAQFTWICWICP